MPNKTCQNCGCSEIDTDTARGESVCTRCGTVLEDNIIVSEVQFEEGSHGGSRAIGQMVSAEGQSSGGLNLGFQHGMGKESRQITLQKARRKIVQMAEQIRLNQHCIDMAYNFYKMALTKHLTRGRKNSHVVAACVYMVCRIEKTSHLLLDLSDIVQVNVYELGRTYLHLSTALCLNIPFIDPSLYIYRYAHKLEFGEQTHAVSMTAQRLVQRMKRDWMHTGRRPSGLCGAALLLAARSHDFNRSLKDIIDIVKVCQTTLRKRLMEFAETPSGQLTLDEFSAIDLEEEQDPPCFKEARRKPKVPVIEESPEATEEMLELQKRIEDALEQRKARGKGKKTVAIETVLTNEEVEEEQVTEQFIIDDTMEQIREFIGVDDHTLSNKPPTNEETLDSILQPQDKTTDYIIKNIAQSVRDIEAEEEDVDSPEKEDKVLTGRPTAASLGLKDSIEECMKVIDYNKDTEAVDNDNNNGELDLTELDETELDTYILSEAEAKAKTEMWMGAHAEYLQEMKEKAERKAKEEEENAKKPESKKKKRQVRKRGVIQANSAGEAIEKMLQEKKISSKINYDVLKTLKTSDIRGDAPSESLKAGVFRTPLKVDSSRPSSRSGKGSVGGTPPIALSNLMSSIMSSQKKRLRSESDDEIDEPKSKVIKVDKIKTTKEPPTTPLDEGLKDEGLKDEEEEIEEEEEEEPPTVDGQLASVAELWGQHRGEEEDTNYYEDDDYYDDV